MTVPQHDSKWWRQFTEAPPQLQRAMFACMRAREILEMRARLNGDDHSGLAPYERLLEEREQAELRIREALGQCRPLVSSSGEPTRVRDAAQGRGSAATSDVDRYW